MRLRPDLRLISPFTAVAYHLKWPRRQKMITLRKRYRILVLAALVAAVIVPLGFALSLDSKSRVAAAPSAGNVGIVAASAKTYALTLPAAAPTTSFPHVPDGLKLLFVGSALFGLAGAIRRNH
jgi:hypothetical protein